MKICELYLACENLNEGATFTIRDEDGIESKYMEFLDIPTEISLHKDINYFTITGNHCHVVL